MELTVTDELIKAIKGFGDMNHNASVAMVKMFSKLNRFNRYFMFEANKLSRYRDLYYYPNNRRRFKGKPLVRNRAFAKAYKNERRQSRLRKNADIRIKTYVNTHLDELRSI